MVPACHPLPCGTNPLPWVPRGGHGFPLGNGVTSPLRDKSQLTPSLPSASRRGSSRRGTGVQQGPTSPGMPPSSEEGAQRSSLPPQCGCGGGSGGDSPRWAARR